MLYLSRRIIFFTLLLAVLSLGAVKIQQVNAHPGNTASDGAHYCWTNCDYWGHEYGTRHSHDTYDEPEYEPDYDEPGYNSNRETDEAEIARTAGKEHAEKLNYDYITENAKNAALSDASVVSAGSQATVRAKELCEKAVEFENTPTDTYRSNFQSSYTAACISSYESTYGETFDKTVKQAIESTKKLAEGEKGMSPDMIRILIIGLVCLTGLAYGVYLVLSDDKITKNS